MARSDVMSSTVVTLRERRTVAREVEEGKSRPVVRRLLSEDRKLEDQLRESRRPDGREVERLAKRKAEIYRSIYSGDESRRVDEENPGLERDQGAIQINEKRSSVEVDGRRNQCDHRKNPAKHSKRRASITPSTLPPKGTDRQGHTPNNGRTELRYMRPKLSKPRSARRRQGGEYGLLPYPHSPADAWTTDMKGPQTRER
ncbi:hypothetical protein FA13DRAFT_1281351 [Coprinellus micaceus]|uniref:Uncharacterized protein n=1 Tax=Coprinellus micaceus TaxID=71717 RepID=A0A4Y7SSS4_COPMI|nr:hypothetical protein FA13DRAFT_1281351 [Coprinellus micaceus]